ALMGDAPKEDALPLLAFALQRLWQQYAASGSLTHAHYVKVGGLTGLIEDAAERAMRGIEPEQDAPLPSAPPPKHQADLAGSTFVPALVEINDQGATIRHIAKWANFSEESQELLKRFDRWRLVARKGEAEGGTVEVAHEARCFAPGSGSIAGSSPSGRASRRSARFRSTRGTGNVMARTLAISFIARAALPRPAASPRIPLTPR